MLRNRLRTLKQQINASDLPDDQKLKVQGYITGCYGSLTSFNVLFADEAGKFVAPARTDRYRTTRPIVSSSHPLATFIMVSTGGTCPPS